MIDFGGKTYTYPPLVNGEEIFAEWRILRALAKEKKTMMEKKIMRHPLYKM